MIYITDSNSITLGAIPNSSRPAFPHAAGADRPRHFTDPLFETLNKFEVSELRAFTERRGYATRVFGGLNALVISTLLNGPTSEPGDTHKTWLCPSSSPRPSPFGPTKYIAACRSPRPWCMPTCVLTRPCATANPRSPRGNPLSAPHTYSHAYDI
jgi:hypothetical protein